MYAKNFERKNQKKYFAQLVSNNDETISIHVELIERPQSIPDWGREKASSQRSATLSRLVAPSGWSTRSR